MLDRARKCASPKVSFIHADFLEWHSEEHFDHIICPFFLDVFTRNNLKKVLKKIRSLMSRDGHLIVTDFRNTGNWRHQLLLSWMHGFFKLTTKLESDTLQEIERWILDQGFALDEQVNYLSGFVYSSLYSLTQDKHHHE